MRQLLKTTWFRLLVILNVLTAAVIGLVTNKVSNLPSPSWLEPWFTWSTFIGLVGLSVILTLLLARIEQADNSEVAVTQKLLNLFSDKDKGQQALRNRQMMLKAVKSLWVDGVLKNSLHKEILIELRMTDRSNALVYPWKMTLQGPGQPDRQLPPGTKMIEVFDSVGRSLLILGEPGSGKTTMLLELAREMIDRSEKDSRYLIPVVFSLSSWTEKRRSLAEWLIEELLATYTIPKKVAQGWIDNCELLLLLDGLDEVAPEHRATCAQVINNFAQEYLVPIVVCSRVADYESLQVKLSLDRAVLIQSLTPEQVANYLDQFGVELSTLKIAVRRDANLQELATSPLMLNIMAMVYWGAEVKKVLRRATLEAQRKQLFEAYVDRMFKRRMATKLYPDDKTCYWLSWLARRMMTESQTIFLIEHLQPGWLRSRYQEYLYRGMNVLIFWLIEGLSIGLIIGLAVGLTFGVDTGLIVGLVLGAGTGLIAGEVAWLSKEIKTAEIVEWSWRNISKTNLVFNSIAVFILGFVFGLSRGPAWGLIVGLIGGLITVGLDVLADGLNSRQTERNLFPNQRIWLSAKNGLLFGLSHGLRIGFVLVLMFGFMFGLSVMLIAALIMGLYVGLLAVLVGGTGVFIQHFVLRFFLWRYGYLPWNLVPFLDHCAERIFLRKVGGGYIFIHRYLMEYFASLEPDNQRPAT